jgi:hypothetical protein
MNMTRKSRSRQEVPPIRVEVEIVRLYEELSPPWRLGSADPTPRSIGTGRCSATENGTTSQPHIGQDTI